jgi:LacI family transcriptional regulator
MGNKDERQIIADFLRLRVDGIIFVYSGLSASESKESLAGVACVHVDPLQPQNLPTVETNRDTAIQLLLGHLFMHGHRRFALLGISETDNWRWPSLVAHSKAFGLDPGVALTPVSHDLSGICPIESGRLMAEAALRLPQRPTAFVAINDQVAIGAIQTLRDAGISVPGEISVTGYDNLELARQLRPTLTTIEQCSQVLMETAGKVLLEEIALPPARRGFYLKKVNAPRLIVGESTGPASSLPHRNKK